MNIKKSFQTYIASLVILTGFLFTFGSAFITEKAVTDDMNIIHKGLVIQKNTNEFAIFAIKTFVTQKQSDYLLATMTGITASSILTSELFVYLITISILANSVGNKNE
jgi:hypothetical protein